MSHYLMLRDYQFDEIAEDIRGAILFDKLGNEVGAIDDVIFDHDIGAVRFLVVGTDKGRQVLVPAERITGPISDVDTDFSSDLDGDEIALLSDFQESSLRMETSPQARERQSTERDMEMEGPVAHREGSDRLITPEADEIPVTKSAAQDDILSADLTPQRITDKFGSSMAPLTSPTGVPGQAGGVPNTGASITLGPGELSAPATRGPRWERFAETLRLHLPHLQDRCTLCDVSDRAA